MKSKTLLIYNSLILLEILEEIKNNLDFNIKVYDENIKNKLDADANKDYIIISHIPNEIKDCNILKFPLEIKTLLRKFNVWFLAKKFSHQSSIKVSKYYLDLNSRNISINELYLSLTEKEVQLIMFIRSNNVVSLKDIQKKVWNYSLDLETHTVETHIYRLRKKFLNKFNDGEFIKSSKEGYFIK